MKYIEIPCELYLYYFSVSLLDIGMWILYNTISSMCNIQVLVMQLAIVILIILTKVSIWLNWAILIHCASPVNSTITLIEIIRSLLGSP